MKGAADVVDDPAPDPGAAPSALEARRPDIPVTLSDLASLKGEAIEVIEARVLVLETLRRAAIRATSPEDWILFKSPEEQGGQIIGYLQDCGADRVRDLYGIEVFGIGKPEKIVGNDPAVFHYVITGSGRCKLTRQVLEEVEGGRSSTDDFCKGKTGAELELLVRKAARANLDGNITRELAGMKSVPASDLEDAWIGTKKLVGNCRRGRGFGTRDARLGGVVAADAGIDPPPCPVCKKPMAFRTGQRGNFYSCPDYKAHGKDARTVDADAWIREQRAKAPGAPPVGSLTPAQAAGFTGASPAPAGKVDRELGADEIPGFGGGGRREPGQEG